MYLVANFYEQVVITYYACCGFYKPNTNLHMLLVYSRQ